MDLLHDCLVSAVDRTELTDAEIAEQCEAIDAISGSPEAARASVPHAAALIRSAPFDERPQMLAAQLLERAQHKTGMRETWEALHGRFPGNQLALRYYIRWLSREGDYETAERILFGIIDADDGTLDLLDFAELCAEVKRVEIAERFFEHILALEPENVRVRVVCGKYLFSHGCIYEAFAILDPIRGESLSKTAQGVLEKSDRAVFAMENITPMGGLKTPQPQSVLSNALKLFETRAPRALDPKALNGIVFYTGSLGAGGAERQLTQMASAFHHRVQNKRQINGVSLTRGIDVLVNNIDAARGKDFYLPALTASGVALTVAGDLPVQALDQIDYPYRELGELAPLLPRNARYGLERLVAYFSTTKPDVAYIWQDGAVLTGALAALTAGVPRIAISLRGLPPNLRPEMMKPEYPDLFRALARIPGVSFSCNSRSAADAYAAWLDLPKDKFSVIYNAMRALPIEGSDTDIRRWNIFRDQTGDGFTLGGIFRFTPNKRGLLWLDFAKRALEDNPELRFILVGTGEQLSEAQAKAAALGLEDRVLFTGSSPTPGYWISKMDAVMLLSENEGLPNVLMEAQIAGKPVISTPAGGAAETFIDGHTGYLLSSATTPSQSEFALYADRLVNDQALRRNMGENASISASGKFDRDHVFAQTIRHFMGETINGDRDALARDLVSDLAGQAAARVPAPAVREAYSIFANS